MRDHRKLDVFHLADKFVALVYMATKNFTREETYGLRSQIRRAAVSIPTNIVEGCGRRTQKEFANFLRNSFASMREVLYLADLSKRLGYLSPADSDQIVELGNQCAGSLSNLIEKVEKSSGSRHTTPR
ncbi:MAG: four helix bundle protein [Deltaproteobacteria bacterium]|nr:four helix bundle protein [Deltaproteobacteria bacterium]